MSIIENTTIPRSSEPYARLVNALTLVDGALRKYSDVESMLSGVLGELLGIFDCERAWVLYPCDPYAPTFRVPMERSRPEFSGAGVRDHDFPTVLTASIMRDLLAAGMPVAYDRESIHAVPRGAARNSGVKAQLCTVLNPADDRPWVLGIHHCREEHVYSTWEKEVFRLVANRIADRIALLKALEEREKSERRFTELVEGSPDGLIVLDEQGLVRLFKPVFKEVTGDSAKDFIGKHYTSLPVFTPEITERIGAEIARAVVGGSPKIFAMDTIRPNGESARLEIAFRLHDRGSESPELHATIRDITDRPQGNRK